MKNIRILPAITASFPRINLWTRKLQENQRLVVVNDEDFNPGEFLERIGVHKNLRSSCLITSRNEIMRRQQLFDWLMRNPSVVRIIATLSDESPMPTQHEDFLHYYHSDLDHCPHWERVHRLIEAIDNSQCPIPDEVKKLRNALHSHLELEETEKDVSSFVRKFVEQVSKVEGVINIGVHTQANDSDWYRRKLMMEEARERELRRLEHIKEQMEAKDEDTSDIEKMIKELPLLTVEATCSVIKEHSFSSFNMCRSEVEENIAYGYSMYSQCVLDAGHHTVPAWANEWWAKLLGLRWLQNKKVDLVNKAEVFRAMNSRVIDGVTPSIGDDVSNAVASWINNLRVKVDYADILNNCVVKVKFTYDRQGLKIRILSIGRHRQDSYDVEFEYCNYKGFNPKTVLRLSRIKEQLDKEVEITAGDMNRGEIMTVLRDNYSDERNWYIFRTGISCPSPRMDREYAYFAIANSYRTKPIKSAVTALENQRAYTDRHIVTLKEVCATLINIQSKAQRMASPLTVPEVLGDGKNVTEFESLFPVQLLWAENPPEEIKAISNLPKLNGIMVGISGTNAAGKTVTLKSYLGLVCMAQSGLPVFGTGVSLNIKNVIGGVFITKDEDSLAKQWLIKVTRLLEEAAEVERSKVMVVIDEIGSGTNPIEGMEVGAELLEAIQKLQYSTLWSCQNPRLFEYAQNEMGCIVVKIDRSHEFSEGIGTADFRGLAEITGLSRYLKQAS